MSARRAFSPPTRARTSIPDLFPARASAPPARGSPSPVATATSMTTRRRPPSASFPSIATSASPTAPTRPARSPRIVASGPGLSITGGHGDLNDYSPETTVSLFPEHRDFRIADGPDQVRQTIREQVKYGVDVIKIMASGGVLSKGDQPGAPQYTLEELKVAADTAHQAGRRIAAHAHGAQSIKWAIEAGIDSIEHASLVDDEGIALAKAHGTYFVMDIYNDDYILQVGPKIGMTEEQLTKERGVGQLQRDNFRKAHAAGVKMAFGTDAGVYPHGDNARQFHYMVLYGMTPTEAIQASTISAADLIGRSADVGSLAPGNFADLIAVPTDPLQHIEVLEHVDTVIKGGVLVKGKN